MASSPLPILLLGGAALFLLSRGSEEDDTPSGSGRDSAIKDPPPAENIPDAAASSGYRNVSKSQMQEIQQQLAQLGFDPGKIDGKWTSGGNTYGAVKGFQSAYGLSADGKPGPNTQAKLKEAISGAPPVTEQGTQGAGGGTSAGALPSIKSNQVGFSADLSDFSIGTQWRYSVLDTWLNTQRKAGKIATKYAPDSGWAHDTSMTSLNQLAAGAAAGVMGLGFTWGPLALAATMPVAAAGVAITGAFLLAYTATGAQKIAHARSIEESGATALGEFLKTHTIVVDGHTALVPITGLVRTPAVVEFLKITADYIARFQSSEYPDDPERDYWDALLGD